MRYEAMKKLIGLFLSLVATAAMSHQYNYGHHPGHGHWQKHGNQWVWVVPAAFGGIIVYQATRPTVDTMNNLELKQCSPWTEIQNADGTITRTRTCNQ